MDNNLKLIAYAQAMVPGAVNGWLDDHPEATTTVQDGSITKAKLNSSLQQTVDDVDELKSAISVLEPAATAQDVGKTLVAKTVADGKVTEYEFGEASEVKPDGYYQQMTVGNAEQLVATVGIEDKVPYNFRTSGGSADIGDREVDKIIGGTVAFNQLLDDSTNTQTGCTVTQNGHTFTVVTTASGASVDFPIASKVEGHKYFISIGASYTGELQSLYIRVRIGTSGRYVDLTSLTSNITQYSKLMEADDVAANKMRLVCAGIGTYTIQNVTLFDLTQMFGSTIADYIYSLETATAGAGVAFFRKLFPKPYYAYNAGELMHVKTSGHKMVGFNQWDEEWEQGSFSTTTGEKVASNDYIRTKNPIRVLPNTSYYIKPAANGRLFYYDASGAYLSASDAFNHPTTITTDANCCYMNYRWEGATYNNDICINFHWDGERDGEYEPYTTRTYPLDSDLVLRGKPRLDASNNLYYDGDEYADDGTVTRKYLQVTYDGTENWGKESSTWNSNGMNVYYLSIVNTWGAFPSTSAIPNIISDKLVAASNTTLKTTNVTGLIGFSGGSGRASYIDVIADAGDLAAFKAWLSNNPVTVVYELSEPTTEAADPYTNPQIVDDFGTEEYIDTRTIPIPVGHDTMYRANLRAKLEMAPDSPNGDGDYIVRQTNGVNEYVLHENELPTAPTTDGNYHLKLTVSGTTKTLTWEADT